MGRNLAFPLTGVVVLTTLPPPPSDFVIYRRYRVATCWVENSRRLQQLDRRLSPPTSLFLEQLRRVNCGAESRRRAIVDVCLRYASSASTHSRSRGCSPPSNRNCNKTRRMRTHRSGTEHLMQAASTEQGHYGCGIQGVAWKIGISCLFWTSTM